jgi:hypothetical protein
MAEIHKLRGKITSRKREVGASKNPKPEVTKHPGD